MKVWISRYRNHWLSPYTILKAICFWEKDEDRIYNLADEPNNPYELWVNLLDPICTGLQWFLDQIHPRWTYVRIDPWDTWSMDHTLADIILPMLKQLKETKHGAPYTDDEDVPEYLRSHMAQPKENEWDTDDLHFMRWDWILAEMIWAFEQKVDHDAESQFFDYSAYTEEELIKRNLNDIINGESKTKYDREGHEKWQARKSNGFRLFGKYYENLWD
jgi:hypothetical protein